MEAAALGLALKQFAAGALAFLKGLPRDLWYAVAIGALLFNTYGSFDVWFVHWQGWKPHALAAEKKLADRIEAENGAAKAQVKILTVTRTIYVHDAGAADDAHAKSQVVVHDATDRFIAANGCVHAPAGGSAGAAVHPAADGDPGVPDGVPADPVVAVGQADVRRAADDAAYAIDAHNWAMSLIRDGVAVPASPPK